MPKLPIVKSRQSRVSGQPSQVAGALIPDNTQHSWRDDVGEGFQAMLAVSIPLDPHGRQARLGRSQ